MRMAATLVALAALISTMDVTPHAATAAEAQAPAWTETDANLPAPFQSWTAKTNVEAAATPSGLDAHVATEGKALDVALHPTNAMTWVTTPEKSPAASTFAGLLELKPASAGTYVIAASNGAWLDVLQDGKPIASSAHAHGPTCSTIHKQVEFQLTPGRYVLQISSTPEAHIGVLFARKPWARAG
jgi:hypothetical protein